jgi:AraC-like DNA-binding protein
MEAGRDIPLLLEQWSKSYSDWFSRLHALPPALRAARVIEQRFSERLTVTELARAAGCSRTTLVELFARCFEQIRTLGALEGQRLMDERIPLRIARPRRGHRSNVVSCDG